MIHEVEEACKQVLEIVQKHQVNTIQGDPIEIEADTICIHGDGINAIEFAKAIHTSLKNNQIEITQA
jgi:UPF0271 protein